LKSFYDIQLHNKAVLIYMPSEVVSNTTLDRNKVF